MQDNETERVSFILRKSDRELLTIVANENGGSSWSAALRFVLDRYRESRAAHPEPQNGDRERA
jgi:hypothetical protein